jgi:Flp pilus assembly protein TadG
MKTKSRTRDRFERGPAPERGQSMVEFALLLPIFLTMVFGIIEFSRAWGAKHGLTIAAREGARILMLPAGAGLPYETDEEVIAAAEKVVKAYMGSSGVAITSPTQILRIKISAGEDRIFGTTDDITEEGYTKAVRGDRVGFKVSCNFESPIAAILGMFGKDDNAIAIEMSASSMLEHE